MCAARSRPTNLDALIETAVVHGQLSSGRSAVWVATKTQSRAAVVLARGKCAKPGRAAPWSDADDNFLHTHLGQLSEEEISRQLGRTVTAIHLRWKRDLKLPAPSKHPDFITTQKIADKLGVDCKAAMRWVDSGLLPGRRLPFNGRVVRSVSRVTFLRWALNPMNWIYFRPERVRDKHLRRLLRQRKKRWGDEWLTPGQVAALHGVTHTAVNSKIHAGELQAVKWGNWRILRSEATKSGLRFIIGKGATQLDWSEAADAFLILARAVGLSTNAIATLVGGWQSGRVAYRLRELHRRRLIPRLIQQHQLKVLYQPRSGLLLADWKHYRNRFPRLARAMEHFSKGESLNKTDAIWVRGVLHAWAAWHAGTASQHDLARRLTTASHSATSTLRDVLAQMQAWRADPFKRLR